MTSREQFELVCKKAGLSDEDPLRIVAWAFWQASREAVDVQLPDRRDYEETLSDHELGFNIALELCAEAIRAAGIKIIEGEQKNG